MPCLTRPVSGSASTPAGDSAYCTSPSHSSTRPLLVLSSDPGSVSCAGKPPSPRLRALPQERLEEQETSCRLWSAPRAPCPGLVTHPGPAFSLCNPELDPDPSGNELQGPSRHLLCLRVVTSARPPPQHPNQPAQEVQLAGGEEWGQVIPGQ